MYAKKMFIQLGMISKEDNKGIEYHFIEDMDYPYGYYAYIFFDYDKKEVRSNLVDISKYEKAISKQERELGWK